MYLAVPANVIVKIIHTKNFNSSKQGSEVFHYSNDGFCSWYDFAKEIGNFADLSCSINPIFSKDYPQAAQRPKKVLLNKDKIKNFYSIELISWKDSLRSCIKFLSSSSN